MANDKNGDFMLNRSTHIEGRSFSEVFLPFILIFTLVVIIVPIVFGIIIVGVIFVFIVVLLFLAALLSAV